MGELYFANNSTTLGELLLCATSELKTARLTLSRRLLCCSACTCDGLPSLPCSAARDNL